MCVNEVLFSCSVAGINLRLKHACHHSSEVLSNDVEVNVLDCTVEDVARVCEGFGEAIDGEVFEVGVSCLDNLVQAGINGFISEHNCFLHAVFAHIISNLFEDLLRFKTHVHADLSELF